MARDGKIGQTCRVDPHNPQILQKTFNPHNTPRLTSGLKRGATRRIWFVGCSCFFVFIFFNYAHSTFNIYASCWPTHTWLILRIVIFNPFGVK